MSPTVIDHITITAPSLAAGKKLVEDSLGVIPQNGGEHPRMGTHNLLLSLGDALFLEVIAINPAALAPDRPRWFALDELEFDSPAVLRTWVVRTDDIQASVNACSESIGNIETMSRGERKWQMTFPDDGSLPINGSAPALIEWQGDMHPSQSLNDYGLSLVELQIFNAH
ncbi:MAG: VOC family protein [Kangiellaceae bacterium]|jgi:hypothetical protein|nr:VOC family protein [Kangiellaceae bacterium]